MSINEHGILCCAQQGTLTTWLMLDTFDWRMVTASPIEGLVAKALVAVAIIIGSLFWATSLDNIFLK